MRLTVGPLPSAVYWRRRAIVLGALFVVILVLFTTCRGEGGSGAARTGATTGPTTGSEPTDEPAPDVDASATTAPPAQTPTTAAAAGPGPATTSAPAQAADGSCTDTEIKVTPVPAMDTAPAGQTIVIKLRIKNESDRTCTRDVGPDEQEIYIKRGAQVIWSSDKCGTVKGSDPQPFTKNFEREYRVSWNGRQSSTCSNSVATGKAPDPGEYQVFGRLGTDHSTPVKLTLT